LVVIGTVALVAFGIDLLDGEVETRRLGEVDVSQNAARYSAVVIGYLLACALIVLGWLSLIGEWKRDYRMSLKPPIDDPDRRRPV
jgi:hypothetical protein